MVLQERCVHGVFERRAQETPEAVALVYEDQHLTYEVLNRRANQLARHLTHLEVGAESLVGICVDRSPEMLVGLLAILKSGGAYVPLDPAYPESRLAFMLENSKARVLLTQSTLPSAWIRDPSVEVVCLDTEWEAIAAQDPGDLLVVVRPENLAYVIYTSGSTGTPKGTQISRGALFNLLNSMHPGLGLDDEDVLLAVTSVSFDIAGLELFLPLLIGSRLEIASRSAASDGARLREILASSAVTALQATPATWRLLLEAGWSGGPSFKALCGGESLTPDLANELLERSLVLWNLYGPTETTIWSTTGKVSRRESSIPIGQAIANTRIYVLDAEYNVVPSGVAGDLYIGGDGLARGYLDRPDLTAEAFIPDPMSREPGSRMYRTGDLARFSADGELEFLGRKDAQVKLRGYRIELEEIETVLRQHPDVSNAVVSVREDCPGQQRLAAYVVFRTRRRCSARELRAFLKNRLPEYMVPVDFSALERVPLTPNGKVDRKALPRPSQDGLASEAAFVEPRTPMERKLAQIWAEVLGVAGVSIHDRFFDMGGHSLLAMRVVSRIRRNIGVEASLRIVFEDRSLEALAEHLEVLLQESGHPPPPEIRSVPRGVPLPLSFAQERMWFLDRLEKERAAYNEPIAVRIRGALDTASLRHALNELVRRHETLRTVFRETESGVVQVVLPVERVDLEAEEVYEEERVQALLQAEARCVFDLTKGPLLRARLWRSGIEEHVLLITVHHIVSDGWSLEILLRELGSLYSAFSKGECSPLKDLSIQYADYAVWQRKWLHDGVLRRQLDYWTEKLKEAPVSLDLPTDRPWQAAPAREKALVRFTLEKETLGDLERLAKEERATLFMTLLASFEVLLFRYSGQSDLLVGTPIANRTREETEEIIGFFVNTLVLRTDLSGNPSFRELLGRVRETALGAYTNQDLPFEKLVEELHPARDFGRSPLFQVMFAMEDVSGAGWNLDGLETRPIEVVAGGPKFDLTLFMETNENGLSGRMEYDTALFERSTIERMVAHYCNLLRGVVSWGDRPIEDLPILSPDERQRILVDWNDTGQWCPSEKCIPELFEEQVAKTPDAVAVIFGNQHITYGELNCRANRLAHHLLAHGVKPETLVGICMERSPEMLVGLLGIQKAGGAYVPLDPNYPRERLAFMLEDSGARLLLTQASLCGSFRVEGSSFATILLDLEKEVIDARPSDRPKSTTTSENLAYVIYTSGSLGQPKGVAITHRSAVALIAWAHGVFEAEALKGVLASTSICFDLSVFEIFVPLSGGGTVLLVENALKLLDLESGAVTLVNTVPSAMKELIRMGGLPDSVRVVNLAGEALDAALVQEIYRHENVRRVYDLYGPTEDTTYSTCARRRADGPITIGRPIANTRVYLLDARMRPVPPGVPGELYIGGWGLARGYLNRPQLTAERFVPDPFGEKPGARLYRTGDLARFLPDGDIEFLGRLDNQVKIRGFRIELGEIETSLRQHPAVTDAVVVAREDLPGQKRLVAYVVLQGTEQQTFGALRKHLKGRLPEYMVPSDFMVLDSIPLTPNGKVNRKALPVPDNARPRLGIELVSPATPLEKALARIWSEVLGISEIGVQDVFFELGGHSLLATRVISRVRQVLQVELPLRSLFEKPTIAGMAECIEVTRMAGKALPATDILPLAHRDRFELSFAQQRLWFLDQLEPGNPAYNVSSAVRLYGALEVEPLRRSLEEIVRRHEVLRLTFDLARGDAAPASGWRGDLRLVDLSAAPEGESGLERLAEEEAQRPFDLSQGPLLRAVLFRVSDQDHVLLLTMHHIVSDVWSLDILNRELWTLYSAFREDRPSPLAELQIQYADFAAWQRKWLRGDAWDTQISYWKRNLAGAPRLLELPTDRPRPAVQTFRGASLPFRVSREISERLAALSLEQGTTSFMFLLAIFKVLLSRYSGQSDIVVGTPIANRSRVETEPLIGFFLNTLALRADLSANPAFQEFLDQVRETALGAYAHQDLPFEKLVETLQPERSLSHTPLFQVTFVHLQEMNGGCTLPGLTVQPLPIVTHTSKFDLSLFVEETLRGLNGTVEYNTDLFDPESISRLTGSYLTLLESVLAPGGLDRRISDLPLLTSTEKQKMLADWSGVSEKYPGTGIHVLFEKRVEETPDAVALAFEDQQLTYRELNCRANQLAHHLIGCGIEPDARVGICLERSLEMVIGILGILKAGGAYVPLDPDYPRERLTLMLRDARVRMVLTRSAVRDSLREVLSGVEALCLDTITLSDQRDRNPLDTVAPDNLAYVIYTSGSTGRPKGVMVSHRSIANHMEWMNACFPLTDADAVLQKTPFSFDASVWEYLAPLLSGARLVMARAGGHQDPAYLLQIVESQGITILQLVPSLLRLLVGDPALGRARTLRRVFCGGEVLTQDLAWSFHACCRADLINLYGPTETTIDSVYWESTHSEGRVPIGRPVTNTRAYILDAFGQPVPVGVAGELHIGGVQGARGYLDDPGQTAERFLPDPSSREPGARMYRTGDLARWLPDGNIEYLGRTDLQVKLRGFRIELGEIETALVGHPQVKEAIVMVREDSAGDPRLVAYLTANASSPDRADLRAHLLQRLPEHMVPSAFVVLESLPLTPSGKVDRKALPAPDWAARDSEKPPAAPRSPVEQAVLEIWTTVLDSKRIGIHDNFFESGGHSLLAMQVISKLRQVFQVELPIRALFEEPTAGSLAKRVESALKREAAASPIGIVDRKRAIPFSFAQQRMWFLEHLEPGNSIYNIPLALRLRGRLDAQALERSLAMVVNRHEMLRTTFAWREGQGIQIIASEGQVVLPVVDLRTLGAGKADAEAARLVTEECARPFDLTKGPLLRAKLLLVDQDQSILILSMHHIVSDGWSIGVLQRELWHHYAVCVHSERPTLPRLPIQYADFSVWQREWLQGVALAEQLAYWKEKLKNAPGALELPADRARPAVQTYRGAGQGFRLSPEVSERLAELSQREGVTLFMTLLAIFKVLIYRYTAQPKVVVGTPIAGRNRGEVEDLIGLFVNTLVLRTDLDGNPTFRELLCRVKETALGAYTHQDLPFEKLVEELQPVRDLSRSPLFQVMFAFQDLPGAEPKAPGIEVKPLELETRTSKFDLTLSTGSDAQGLWGSVEYNADLFEQATIARLIEHFQVLVNGVLQDPDGKIGRLPLMASAETQRIVAEWNDTSRDYLRDRFVHELISEHAERTPDAVAVIFEGRHLCYGELNRRANRLARHLKNEGVGPEALVGICLERSLEMVIGLLAVLKVGGAYVPLDPTYPRERLVFMLGDAQVRILLTQTSLASSFASPGELKVICLDAMGDAWAGHDDSNLRDETRHDQLAYVIYTSGSTGQPKGAMNTHGGLLNRMQWMQDRYGLGRDDRVLQKTPFGFDVSVWEFFWPLMTGASLVMARPEGQKDSTYLAGVIVDEQVTTLHFVPSLLEVFLEEPSITDCRSLRRVICSGEALPSSLPSKYFSKLDAELHNLYGPTEAAIDVSSFACPRDGDGRGVVPIGRPIANLRLYILDVHMEPLPIGIAGELYIGGAGLARGYVNRPDLTAEKFLPDPFSREGGGRLYRTGDLARYRVDGSIEFLGRMDQQVKLRGFRIELGEIEAALRRHPGIRDAVVVAWGESTRDRRLVAYVVSKGGIPVDPVLLKEHLERTLPRHMVPAALINLDALPLNPNGKVDRNALIQRYHPERHAEAPPEEPKTVVEKKLSKIWKQLLGLKQVRRNENFFSKGGHSLTAIQLVHRMRNDFQVEIQLRTAFEASTLSEMAEKIETLQKEGSSSGTELSPSSDALIENRGKGYFRRLMKRLFGNDKEQ